MADPTADTGALWLFEGIDFKKAPRSMLEFSDTKGSFILKRDRWGFQYQEVMAMN